MKKVKRKRLSDEEKERLLEKTDCRCGHCGKKLTIDTMTVEHVHPLSKGGDYTEFNMVALCEACNTNKSNYMYHPVDYFKYINEDYLPDYIISSLKFRNQYRIDNMGKYDILTYGALIYRYLPEKMMQLVHNTYKRSKTKALNLMNNIEAQLILEYAYEAQAKQIAEYTRKMKEKYDIDNKLYDNEYSVIAAIKNGKVLTLTRPDNSIAGLFILDDIRNQVGKIAQLKNITEVTELNIRYVITYCFSALRDRKVFSSVMEDLMSGLLNCKVYPVFFNCLSDVYKGKAEYIGIPHTYNRVDGNLEFFTIKGIRQLMTEQYKYLIDIDCISEQERDDIIEKYIYGKPGESEKLFEKAVERYYKEN